VLWERVKIFLAQWVGTWLTNTVARSLRVRIVNDEGLEELEKRHGAICFCGWHNKLLVPLHHHRFVKGYALASEHTDGELVGRVLQNWGYTLIRGSTTHGAVRALIQVVRAVRAGHSIGITPDGPRGPRYVVQPGVVLLAQKAQCPLVPLGFASSWYVEFNSWDRFQFPLPCARAEIRYGEPILVPAEVAEDEIEVWRKRVEDGLMRVTREAEASVGLPPEDARQEAPARTSAAAVSP
jgi:hypothetical protein